MHRRVAWACGLFAVGALGILAVLLLSRESRSTHRLRGEPGPLPFTESRLTGDLQLDPLSFGQAPEPTSPADLQRFRRTSNNLEARLAAGLSGDSRAEALHGLGLLRLQEGRIDDAVLVLEEAATAAPPTASLLTDLAGVYLIRSPREHRPFDLVLALDAADRALALERGLPEALFNRAAALTRLHLDGLAIAAWQTYLGVDSRSGWSTTARRHLGELHRPTLAQLWEKQRPELDAALARRDQARVRTLVDRFPDLSRLHAEAKLFAWAGAEGAPANAALTAARGLGRVLEETTGDGMIADSLAAIERALAAADTARLSRLRRGHRAYGRAMQEYAAQALLRARPLLVEAHEALAAGGSPFAAWAELYVAIIDSYRIPEQASRSLLDLRRRLSPARYPSVVGRIDWMLSTNAAQANRHERTLTLARSSMALLARAAGPSGAANPRIVAAIAYRDLGQPERAWNERLAALAAIRRGGDPRRVHVALHDAAEELLEGSLAGPALVFAEESLHHARAWGNPAGLTNARLVRGRALAALGRDDEALEELRASRRHADAVPPGDIRTILIASIDLAEGRVLAARAPRQAIHLMGQALAARESLTRRYRIESLLLTRARAYLLIGDVPRAEADLGRAIEEHERTREGIADMELRGSSFALAQEAFEEMVALQVDRHGDDEAALDYAERARSRLLLDLVGAGKASEPAKLPRALPAQEILSRVPEGVSIIEYMVLPDRLLTWVCRRGSVRLISTPVRRPALDRTVSALRLAFHRRAGEREIRRQVARLYEWLIRPLEREIADGVPFVVVPDRSLVWVPFSALFDARRGQFLNESHTLTVAPSATLYLTALERSGTGRRGPRTVLAVGDPSFDSELYPRLERLPEAAKEAAEVAALYEEAEVLRGDQATPSAFLSRAPAYQVVHFGGHSLLHPGAPRLSTLVLAPEPGRSGALFAQDLAGLRLDTTELVVLSACQTIEGSTGGRESIVGLAAAFLAAGPPVVVASLWKVGDEATRALMLPFHRALRGGSDPASALRAAQRALASDRTGRFRSPADWAGFEVFGGAPVREN